MEDSSTRIENSDLRAQPVSVGQARRRNACGDNQARLRAEPGKLTLNEMNAALGRGRDAEKRGLRAVEGASEFIEKSRFPARGDHGHVEHGEEA